MAPPVGGVAVSERPSRSPSGFPWIGLLRAGGCPEGGDQDGRYKVQNRAYTGSSVRGRRRGGIAATPPTADRRTSIGAILDFVTAILIAAFGTASGSQETNPREAARRARRT